MSTRFSIIVFDDGNIVYKNSPNVWIVTGSRFNGGKVSLKNAENENIIIKSISSWKIRVIEVPE